MSEANVAENQGAPEEPSNENKAEPVDSIHLAETPENTESSPGSQISSGSEVSPGSLDISGELLRANERALRAQAELENFRKRIRREMEEDRRYASLALIAELLPVIDNLERAVEAAEQTEGGSGLLDGVKMVRTQLLEALDRFHCRRIDANGVTFDPNLQEAIGKESSEEHADGVVTRVVGVGYQLHDRVVRPSQVMISSGPPQEPQLGQSES